jgi:hypothetical protein
MRRRSFVTTGVFAAQEVPVARIVQRGLCSGAAVVRPADGSCGGAADGAWLARDGNHAAFCIEMRKRLASRLGSLTPATHGRADR